MAKQKEPRLEWKESHELECFLIVLKAKEGSVDEKKEIERLIKKGIFNDSPNPKGTIKAKIENYRFLFGESNLRNYSKFSKSIFKQYIVTNPIESITERIKELEEEVCNNRQ